MKYAMSEETIKSRLKAVKLSMASSERNAVNTQKRAKRTVAMLQANELDLPESARTVYYRLLYEYNYATSFAPPCDKPANEIPIWKRVAKCCEDTELTPSVYLKAQFQWFHAAFGKSPTFKDLATKQAKDRALQYEETQFRITSNVLPHKKDLATILRNADKQMAQLCDARNMTRAEVYEQLVKPGLFIFPKEYLEADPEYRKIR